MLYFLFSSLGSELRRGGALCRPQSRRPRLPRGRPGRPQSTQVKYFVAFIFVSSDILPGDGDSPQATASPSQVSLTLIEICLKPVETIKRHH